MGIKGLFPGRRKKRVLYALGRRGGGRAGGMHAQRPVSAIKDELEFGSGNMLGQGSYGKVFMVKRKDNGRILALKTRQEDDDELEVEAANMNRLREHENLMLHSTLYKGGGPGSGILLEFMSGSLLDLITVVDQATYVGGPFDELYRGIVADIARGLDHMHERNIVHLDLKPANILVRCIKVGGVYEMVARIADLGLARSTTTPFQVAYSDGYRAPEVEVMCRDYARGRVKRILPRKSMDIWAFGVIVYNLVTSEGFHNYNDPADYFTSLVDMMGYINRNALEPIFGRDRDYSDMYVEPNVYRGPGHIVREKMELKKAHNPRWLQIIFDYFIVYNPNHRIEASKILLLEDFVKK